MFTETLNSTSRKEETMELENSMEESDDEEEDDGNEFPPLPSDIDFVVHKNTSDPYDNRNHAIDLFHCPSPAFPSPPPSTPPPPPSFLPASSMAMSQIYANVRTFSSIRMPGNLNQPTISFATQQKKKARAPIANLVQSIYVNMPILRSPTPPLSRPVNTPDEVTYATLLNTTSIMPSMAPDLTIDHVEYQQIQVHRPDSTRIYENIKPRRPPPEPYYSQTNAPKRPPSVSTIVPEVDKVPSCTTINSDDKIAISSAHIYINLQYDEDKPPLIPTRTCKSTPIIPQISSLSPPPVIPRRKVPTRCSPSHVTISSTEKDQKEEAVNNLETSSNASSVQTIKELEINMTPNCGDKSDLYRTKMSLTGTENLPTLINARQRRTIHSARRRRLRGSIALRNTLRGGINHQNSQRQQQPSHQRSHLNVTVRHPMVTDDRWRRTLRKRRRQRAVQMKLDGNILHQQTRPARPISDHTYNEIKQAIPENISLRANPQNGPAGGVLERAMQFNGALRDRVFSWYRGANHNGREPQTQQQVNKPAQVCSISENGESDPKDSMTQEDEDEEEEEEEEEEQEEEEEEFFTHDTFEDFLLRRRPKSSASTTASGTSTIVSRIDSVSQRLPVRTSPKHKTRPLPPPPPPLPPPIPPTPPPARRFSGLALGLDKTDVDFIHNILQRTRGDHRVWNRITALKEAYIRATSKKSDLPKKPKPIVNPMDNEKKKKKEMTMKHSLAATKIRAELEKYDELPASSATVLDDEDDYDETCSANDHRKIHHHHRSVPALPQTPSTTHRLLNFVTSMKRRAQSNVQQLQKNLHDIRSRVHIEAMSVPPNHIGIQRHTSNTSRQRQTFKDSSHTSRMHLSRAQTASNQNPLVRRTNSHRSATSVEHSSAAMHRRQLNRTQSNASQLPQRHTHRTMNAVEPSSSLIARPLPFERRSSRQTQGAATSRRQRAKQT